MSRPAGSSRSKGVKRKATNATAFSDSAVKTMPVELNN
jgi:hypothetical protein